VVINWDLYSRYLNTIEDLQEFEDHIDWTFVLMRYMLPEAIIYKYLNKLDLTLLATHQKLSEKFIHEKRYDLNWKIICGKQRLSETFIREHIHFIDWMKISSYPQILSEEFIHEYRNLLNWSTLVECTEMSDEFLYEHREFVDWGALYENGHGNQSEEFIRNTTNYVPWKAIHPRRPDLEEYTEEFMYEFSSCIYRNWHCVRYNYQRLKERRSGYLQQIIAYKYHPSRVAKWIEEGRKLEDM
jgi:hypothetical protein